MSLWELGSAAAGVASSSVPVLPPVADNMDVAYVAKTLGDASMTNASFHAPPDMDVDGLDLDMDVGGLD